MATTSVERPVSAAEFLAIDFGPDLKPELDRGVIRMMAGGTYAHASIQANVSGSLLVKLRGSGCRPYGSDMAVRTGDWSIRYPDVTIDCGSLNERARDKVLADPRVIVEVLSPSTRDDDLGIKLSEYRSVLSIHTIAFVDPEEQTIAVTNRTAHGGWTDVIFSAESDLMIAAMDLTIQRSDVFATD